MATAASILWAWRCARRARYSSANTSWRRSTGSAAISPAPPNLSAWSARRCTASSRRLESIEVRRGRRGTDKHELCCSQIRCPSPLSRHPMSRIAYVNGRYLPFRDAKVHVEDRGYQFADGVYEVCEVRGGRLIDQRRHMARLVRSLDELRIGLPMSLAALGVVLRETVRRNRVRDGLVYLQVTRGVARRDHAFPDPPVRPAIVITAKSVDLPAAE